MVKSGLYLHKVIKDNEIQFREIPNIPRYGERLEDIGMFKRKDLRKAENLKPHSVQSVIILPPMPSASRRDEVFASQLINLIFCKIYDERFTKPDDTVKFRAGVNESEEDIYNRILTLFDRVKHQYNDVIEVSDSILLDPVLSIHCR